MNLTMRPRQNVQLAAMVFLFICIISIYRWSSSEDTSRLADSDLDLSAPIPPPGAPPGPLNPHPIPGPEGVHPMRHLISEAQKDFESTLKRQSKTLDQAVDEYRRRYGIHPPPNFDKWFEFAKAKDVQLVDEFDTIQELLMPFWGLKPETIRARAMEALGFDNALLGIQIRNGRITHLKGGGQWQQEATAGMMGKFIHWLPNMDLCFNLHDEPRVVVPHDDLSRLIKRAKDINMPAAGIRSNPRNAFSNQPEGLNDGLTFVPNKLTRFNVFAHQPTWTHSRLSCPPDSPARQLEEDERIDDVSRYGMSELGFIYNVSAMSDICYTPSLSSTFGFFDRPNAFNIVHDLFPIFSQSKISTFNDILYPSPWYWYEKVTYDEAYDYPWTAKKDKLYWRGSTTGGFSRNGGWRRQHRQRIVSRLNQHSDALIMTNKGTSSNHNWEAQQVLRDDYRELVDVFFSGVGQCDPVDCEAQKRFFTIKGHAQQWYAWAYKFLLDMDGNAFSGRFYAFLKSKSLVYKFAIFREWHLEWLKPWAHYLPLSQQGDEWVEAVRFFTDSDGGQQEAEKLANQQKDWANQVLRHEDMEVWFFRLLLEYGRVIDDDRAKIGFSMASAGTVGE